MNVRKSILGVIFTISLCRAVHVDLKFDVKLKHVPHECRKIFLSDNNTCKLPYAVSLLESFGDFDLQAVMLQDGYASHYGKERRRFSEDTVVPVPLAVRSNGGDNRLYVGVKLYGLPKFVQDYFVIDITKMLKIPATKSIATVESNDISFIGIVRHGKLKTVRLNNAGSTPDSCGCAGLTCSCCSHLDIPKISLNETGCINVTYLPDQYGISFTVSLNGKVVYNDTISARNPPPVCFNAPYLKEYASLCLRFHDLDVTKNHLYGCVRVEAELYHVRVGEIELGCFHLGPKERVLNLV